MSVHVSYIWQTQENHEELSSYESALWKDTEPQSGKASALHGGSQLL